MSRQNKAAVERLLQAFASAPESAVAEHFTPDWVNHDPSGPLLQGLEGAAELVRLWFLIHPIENQMDQPSPSRRTE